MDELYKLLEADGYSQEDDSPLFRYADWWGESNALLPVSVDTKYEFLKATTGFAQYLATGDVILEDD